MIEITAELLDEATETVYARYNADFPEFSCLEHGHYDCAFYKRGTCTRELIDRELGRMLR